MLKRKGFTLIELLVVIAIIAILAAILFPVFAQAKASAKKAASISNDKQVALGLIMYGSDNDDKFPLATAWNTGNDPLSYGANTNFSTWGWLTQPYIKNGQIFYDPQAQNTPNQFNNVTITATCLPNYGYNYVFLSPWGPENPPRQKPVTQTSAAQPASTVMVVSRGSFPEGDGFFWGFGFDPNTDNGPMLNSVVEVPDCYSIPQYCADNWGVGGFTDGAGATPANGGLTGGVSVRSGGVAIVAFVDGHVAGMKPAALAAGTNWTPTTQASALVQNDKSKYLWDLE